MGIGSTNIANLSKVEKELAEIKGELRSGQKAIGQTLGEIKDRQAAQNDMLADINVALTNGFASLKEGQDEIKKEITRVGYGIASLNDKQAESVEILKEIRGHGKILKEIAASLKQNETLSDSSTAQGGKGVRGG